LLFSDLLPVSTLGRRLAAESGMLPYLNALDQPLIVLSVFCFESSRILPEESHKRGEKKRKKD
jgi:hypothetical protein